MTTQETKNAHPRDRMPTPDIRHSPQKLQQKPLGWACHKFEVDMILPLGCNASISDGVECQLLEIPTRNFPYGVFEVSGAECQQLGNAHPGGL